MMHKQSVLLFLFLSVFPSIVVAMDGERQGGVSPYTPPAGITAGDGVDDADSPALNALSMNPSKIVDDTVSSKQELLADEVGEAPIPLVADASSIDYADEEHPAQLPRDAEGEEQTPQTRLLITDRGHRYYLGNVSENVGVKEPASLPIFSYPSTVANVPQKTNFQERFPGRLPARRGSLDPMERREARREFSRNNARRATNRLPGVVRPRASGIVIGRSIR